MNPQPEAHVVFQRVLDWIDRCDVATQTGAPKPEFQTTSGEPIFPESEEPWWLTDISRRLGQESKQQEADEDGPASDGEEKEEADEQKELEDDDPSSEPEQVSASASSRAYENPNVAWHRQEWRKKQALHGPSSAQTERNIQLMPMRSYLSKLNSI